jgi:hypothetical protein
MSRTTIMAPDDLLDQLRVIAKEEGVSLGEVIREALTLRARLGRSRPPSFIGAIATGEPGHDTAFRHEEILYARHS